MGSFAMKNPLPLLIVGDTSQMPSYTEELKKLSGKDVYFHPLIKDPRIVFGLMASSYCLIFPSLFEAMSMVLLEAAYNGVPVVCSDIEENRYLGEDAIYFASGNSDSLVEKLNWVLENPESVIQITSRAQEKIRREYSWDTIAESYV